MMQLHKTFNDHNVYNKSIKMEMLFESSVVKRKHRVPSVCFAMAKKFISSFQQFN